MNILRGGEAQARGAFERMLEAGQALGDRPLQAKAHGGLAMVVTGDRPRMLEHYRQAERLHDELGELGSFAAVSGRRAWLQYHLGDVRGALSTFDHASRRLKEVPEGFDNVKLINAWGRSVCLQALGHYEAALTAPEAALAASSGQDEVAAGWRRVLALQRGRVLLDLGAVQEAVELIEPAIRAPGYFDNIRGRGLIALAQALRAAGRPEEARLALSEAEALYSPESEPYYWITLQLEQAELQAMDERLPVYEALLELATRKQHAHLALAVRVRQAQARLALGQPIAAEPLEGDAAGVLSPGEVLLTRAQMACTGPEPEVAIQALSEWVSTTGRLHVPAAYQAAFQGIPAAAWLVHVTQPHGLYP